MYTLLINLEDLFYDFIKRKGTEPTLILMHPNMYEYMRKAADSCMYYTKCEDNAIKSFKGVKIKRSLDVEESNIEFY